MNLTELHELVPYARYGKAKVLTMSPYPNITLAMPGRHAEDCSPKGGDFVVMVTDKGKGWKKHQFKHDDIFLDVQDKLSTGAWGTDWLLKNYLDIIRHELDPDSIECPGGFIGLDPVNFYHAVQCLAVAEHRRYAKYEDKFGGRYLPFRFAAGIAEGLWTADEAIKVQKYGRPAVERLEKTKGMPELSAKLMG